MTKALEEIKLYLKIIIVALVVIVALQGVISLTIGWATIWCYGEWRSVVPAQISSLVACRILYWNGKINFIEYLFSSNGEV